MARCVCSARPPRPIIRRSVRIIICQHARRVRLTVCTSSHAANTTHCCSVPGFTRSGFTRSPATSAFAISLQILLGSRLLAALPCFMPRHVPRAVDSPASLPWPAPHEIPAANSPFASAFSRASIACHLPLSCRSHRQALLFRHKRHQLRTPRHLHRSRHQGTTHRTQQRSRRSRAQSRASVTEFHVRGAPVPIADAMHPATKPPLAAPAPAPPGSPGMRHKPVAHS